MYQKRKGGECATGWQPVLRWLPTLIVSLRNAVDAYMVAEVVRLRILLFPSEFSRIRPQAGSLCYGGCDASDQAAIQTELATVTRGCASPVCNARQYPPNRENANSKSPVNVYRKKGIAWV